MCCSATERMVPECLDAIDERCAKTECDGVNGGGRNTGRRWARCGFDGDGGRGSGTSDIGSGSGGEDI
jgi:hypothetical protein